MIVFCSWHSVFVATWNVGGKSPSSNLSLDDWLHSAPPADIYVLGYEFQDLSLCILAIFVLYSS